MITAARLAPAAQTVGSVAAARTDVALFAGWGQAVLRARGLWRRPDTY